MTEPQEHSIEKEVISLNQSQQQTLIKRSKGLPQERLSLAKQRLYGFKTLKTELNTDLQVVLEKLEALKNKIKENSYGKDK